MFRNDTINKSLKWTEHIITTQFKYILKMYMNENEIAPTL